ncbi:hypothetical protein CHY_2601 [Carboxydothermus hydrogenoformans Z-2901]|uniref:Uncharacterized protein n=1 Tax=Carboxydothermus hydrogenoformans (strain ATCC BAA-161 / DSM 6008 / Z-2901) TaxID=246194 RepID=Q3A8Z0_CARHZ|nr:hypothetical protein CHY_2601 [Carboxydothermus hydrogenoformans Z-2901]
MRQVVISGQSLKLYFNGNFGDCPFFYTLKPAGEAGFKVSLHLIRRELK